MGRSPWRNSPLPLRYSLFQRHDSVFLFSEIGAIHAAFLTLTGWPFRFGRPHVPFRQGGLAIRLQTQHGRRQRTDTRIFLLGRVFDELKSIRSR